MNEAEFTAALIKHTSACGIPLPAQAPMKCLQHVQLMLAWNRRTNLTRITSLEDILARHILDSLLPSRWLPSAGQGADIGSGAGFPGVPLALALPNLTITLVESSRKKASFLTVLATHLQLPNLKVFHGTWSDWLETTKGRGEGSRMDCITMRAVRLEREHLSGLAEKGLRSGGVFAYWGGPEGLEADSRIMEPWAELETLQLLEPMPYALPGGRSDLRLLRWIRKPPSSP